MGMAIEHVVNEFREYDLVSYSEDVQKYIITNFKSLVEFINK